MRYLDYLSLTFACVGLLVVWASHHLYDKEVEFLSNSVPAIGTVVEFKDCSARRTTRQCPQIQFIAHTNNVSYKTLPSTTNSYGFKIGEAVRINYSRSKPTETQIDNFHAKWASVIGTASFGIVFLVIGGLAGIYSIKTRKNH